VIVVTTESQVFSWGEGSKGQLGHGDTVSLTKPKAVEALTGKLITRFGRFRYVIFNHHLLLKLLLLS
jgi:alpha-tubulin suppressor-like RCC1 family protein